MGVRGEYGAGPLSKPATVLTQFNPRAPPKRLRVSRGDKPDSMIVSWSASCSTIEEPIGYTVILFSKIILDQKKQLIHIINEIIIYS